MKAKLAALSLLSLAFLQAPVGHRGTNSAQLMWSSASGYSLAVKGTGWPASSAVAFELSQAGNVYGLELRTDSTGAFLVGISHFSCSGGGISQARDLSGDQAMAPVLDPCGPGKLQTPTLTVLGGRLIDEKIVRVAGMGHGKVIKIGLGSALYLWEPGKVTPDIMPSAPANYLFLIGKGQAVSPSCHTASCPMGFFWEWIGVKAGNTAIVVRPWCGAHVCPQASEALMAEWVALIRLHIVAPGALRAA